jgi:heme/copper-type cytochrome/quinol oxidase subunit 1
VGNVAADAMTILETRPDAPPSEPSVAPAEARAEPHPVVDWVTTGDHKKIGRLFVAWALLFAVADLVIGALLAFERVDDGGIQVVKADAVNQLYSYYGVTLTFCVVVPLLFGLATAIVPLQVGARSIAFPRAAALSFWTWLVASWVMVGSYLANGGPGGGRSVAVDLFLAAFVVVVAALVLNAICLATTIAALRAPGMTLYRVPFFSWGVLVSASILILSLPVLVGNTIYLYLDHRYGRLLFGGNLGITTYIGWALVAPQLFAYGVAAYGYIADAVSTFARDRLQKPDSVLIGIGLAGVLGFGAWFQPGFYPGVGHSFLAKVAAIGAVLPPLLVLGAIGLTLKPRRPAFGSPLVFAVAALLVALGGAAVGVLLPFGGLNLEGTVYGFAQFNLVSYGAVLAGLGGLVYWGPKLWGRRLSEPAMYGVALLGLLGVALIGIPDVILGFMKQPAATVSDFGIDGPVGFLNALSGVGYIVLALALLGVLAQARQGFSRGPVAGDDPWHGQTLEWATTSPPPDGNFVEPPVVTSGSPLLDVREAAS